MQEDVGRRSTYMLEEEIDLRKYVEVLIRYWPWIVGCALVAAVAAFVVSSLMSPTYESEAGVAIVRIRTDVSFEPRIETLSGEELNGGGDRRQALVALASSSNVAQNVLDEMGTQLKPEERDISSLMGRIETSNEGDLITIKASHRVPTTAAKIADVWAGQYARYINKLYDVTTESEETVASQVAEAKETYEAAQKELESFLGDNRIATLQREIAAKQQLLTVYQEARNAAQARPVELQLNAKRQMLNDYYDDLRRIERWLADARALRAQVEAAPGSGAATVGNALALISLRNRAFGGGGGTPVEPQGSGALGGEGRAPVELQVGLTSEDVEEVQPGDVDTLIDVLESRRTETQERIDSLTGELAKEEPKEVVMTSDNPLNARISILNDDILALQADLEAQQARKKELQKKRDNAWETYQALAQKETEVNVQSKMAGTQVRVASSAVPPRSPASPRKKMNTALAGAVGLMLGVGAVFTWEWWQEGSESTATSR